MSELKDQFAGQDVFVAGDLFWYPVRGNPRIVTAPDGLVVFGRPPKIFSSDAQVPSVLPSSTRMKCTTWSRDRSASTPASVFERYGRISSSL